MRRYVIIIILMIFIIVGVILLLTQTAINPSKQLFWYNTVGNIANTFLIGGTISLLYELLLKRHDEHNLMRMLKISFSIHDSGLRQIMTDASSYHFSDLLSSSTAFVAVLNDGNRWVGNNSIQLQERFDRTGTITEFFLVDPDGDFCNVLALKTEVAKADLQHKIKATIATIITTYERSSQQGKLKIYFLKNYPTQSIFLTEKKVIVTPYQVASGRNTIPLFEYEYESGQRSIGLYISNDITNIRAESKLHLEKG